MSILQIAPHSGINRRFPQHKLTSEKKLKLIAGILLAVAFVLWESLICQAFLAHAETVYNGIRPGSTDERAACRTLGDFTVNETDGTTLTSTWG